MKIQASIWMSLGLLVPFIVWEFSTRLFKIPSWLLPSPSLIFKEIADKFGLLMAHTGHTLFGTFTGLAFGIIAGIALGFVIGYSRTMGLALYPILGGFHALPKVAVVPLLVIWFGVGLMPRVITAFLIAFFPIVVNTVTGLVTIEPELWEMLRTHGATKRQIMIKVGLPRTVPYFFAALKVAAGGAFIGEVVGEMVAAEQGLGYVIMLATTRLLTPLAFAALVILLFLGFVIFVFFDFLERKGAPWAYRTREISM